MAHGIILGDKQLETYVHPVVYPQKDSVINILVAKVIFINLIPVTGTGHSEF